MSSRESTTLVEKRKFYFFNTSPLVFYYHSIINYRKRLDKTIEDLDKKQDTQREALGKLQQQLQQAQVKAAMKA